MYIILAVAQDTIEPVSCFSCPWLYTQVSSHRTFAIDVAVVIVILLQYQLPAAFVLADSNNKKN